MGCTRQQLTAFFDDLLTPQRFKDYCPNGLQVEGKTDVRHLVSGVTASQALIEAARTKLRPAAGEPAWTSLQDVRDPSNPLSDEAIIRTLKAAGTSALNKLLSQRTEPEQSGEAER